MLEIKDLHVEAGGREILKGVSLTIGEGETCVLFGPNGSGKSTLLAAIMGYGHCTVTKGEILFKGQDITHMGVDERARLGIGMMMQRPPNVAGVKLGDLVRAAAGNDPNATKDAESFKMDNFLERDVNVGFSGGEIRAPAAVGTETGLRPPGRTRIRSRPGEHRPDRKEGTRPAVHEER